MKNKYGIIILAAGASTRLGKPKQLLPFEGKSLLRHIVLVACDVPDSVTLVVTGAAGELIDKELANTCAYAVHNDEWASGMAGSLKKGVEAVLKINSDIEACIITVSDQPYVSEEILSGLIKLFEDSGKGICACTYDNTFGTPALFSRKYFPELLSLEGDLGAKRIIMQHSDDLSFFPFEKGKIDIDTEEDYLLLKK